MTDEEVADYFYRLGAAVLAGAPRPVFPEGVTHVRREAVAAGMDRLARRVAERMDRVAEKFPDDLALQERVRREIDLAMAGLVRSIDDIVEGRSP